MSNKRIGDLATTKQLKLVSDRLRKIEASLNHDNHPDRIPVSMALDDIYDRLASIERQLSAAEDQLGEYSLPTMFDENGIEGRLEKGRCRFMEINERLNKLEGKPEFNRTPDPQPKDNVAPFTRVGGTAHISKDGETWNEIGELTEVKLSFNHLKSWIELTDNPVASWSSDPRIPYVLRYGYAVVGHGDRTSDYVYPDAEGKFTFRSEDAGKSVKWVKP